MCGSPGCAMPHAHIQGAIISSFERECMCVYDAIMRERERKSERDRERERGDKKKKLGSVSTLVYRFNSKPISARKVTSLGKYSAAQVTMQSLPLQSYVAASTKVARYREAYANRQGTTYAFLPCVVSTSGRIH
jgi:hypothetical protein